MRVPGAMTGRDDPDARADLVPGDRPKRKIELMSQISAFSRRLCDKLRGCVLNLLAPALRTTRMCGLMFSEMFGVFEQLAADFTTVLVSRHDNSSKANPARARQIRPRRPALYLF
jgi:hypothetical protein